MLRSKKTGIKEKIAKHLNDNPVDVFGYQKIFEKNATNYLEHLSQEENVPMPLLRVKIALANKTLKIESLSVNQRLKFMQPSELITFFVGKTMLPGLHKKVIKQVSKLLTLQAQENGISTEAISLHISKPKDTLRIAFYDGNRFISLFSIAELIQFFS